MALLDRLRRRRDQPVPGVRVDRGHDRRRAARPRRASTRQGGQELHQGRRQGRAQGDVARWASRTVASLHAARRSSRRSASAQELVDEYFTGTVSRLGGIGLDEIAEEVAARHARRLPDRPEERAHRDLELGGEYQWRREGEYHLFNPETVFKLQHATRGQALRRLQASTRGWSTTSPSGWPRCAACSSFKRRRAPAGADRRGRAGQRDRQAVRHRRDVATARSRTEAHETLAIAMNRIGGKSQHRRGRRGRRALRARRQRRPAPLGDQAGGLAAASA